MSTRGALLRQQSPLSFLIHADARQDQLTEALCSSFGGAGIGAAESMCAFEMFTK